MSHPCRAFLHASSRAYKTSHHDLVRNIVRCQSSFAGNTERIYVLGLGNIGRLFAHGLSKSTYAPPITLLLSGMRQCREWESAGQKISIITNGDESTSSKYDIDDTSSVNFQTQARSEEVIENLVLSTKAFKAIEAISSIKHRLSPNPTILLTQNGYGLIPKIHALLTRDGREIQPTYLQAITTHGVYSTAPFRSVHAGIGNIAIGRVGSMNPLSHSQALVTSLVKAPVLVAREVGEDEILCIILEKLVVNSTINPLTVIYNCRNGDILQKRGSDILISRLIDESSAVILKTIETTSDTRSRFEPAALRDLVLRVITQTAENRSSMLQDIDAGRCTEIDYINGAIVDMGSRADLGQLASVAHRWMITRVKDRSMVGRAGQEIVLLMLGMWSWLKSVM